MQFLEAMQKRCSWCVVSTTPLRWPLCFLQAPTPSWVSQCARTNHVHWHCALSERQMPNA